MDNGSENNLIEPTIYQIIIDFAYDSENVCTQLSNYIDVDYLMYYFSI